MTGATSSASCLFCEIAGNSTSTPLVHSMAGATSSASCLFCEIAGNSTSTPLVHSDEKVVAFQDIKPSAYRHYLVIPMDHIPTVRDLQKREEDYSLVRHMFNVGQALLQRDAPQSSQFGFGFHQPLLNSVNHLHLHVWLCISYPGGFIEAEKLLVKIKPLSSTSS